MPERTAEEWARRLKKSKEHDDALSVQSCHEIADAPSTLTAERDELMGLLKKCSWVLDAARLDEMGGTPDLFGPDVDGNGFIAEAGENCWETWDRYATETINHIANVLQRT